MQIATAQIIMALIALVFEKGLPAVTGIISNWDKEEITLEDIEALRDLVKPPEEY